MIEPMLLSDHHPITMTLTLLIWRLDDLLLLDVDKKQKLSICLTQYFVEIATEDTSDGQMCYLSNGQTE